MRPLLVLLLVAAAAATFFFVLTSGEAERSAPSPQQYEAPGPATREDPATMTSLESPGETRLEVTTTEDPQTRTLHPEAQRGNALRGRVVLQDGSGVAGAKVVLTRYGPADFLAPMGLERVPDRGTETDEEGNFSFADVAVNVDYTVVASHPGHGRRTEPFLSVADGEVSEVIQVVLQPGIEVRGAVTDVSGQAIEDAAVRLSLLSVGNIEEGAGVLRTATDVGGVYRFVDVSPGHYSLTVEKDGFGKTQLQRIEVVDTPERELIHDVTLEIAHLIAGTVRDTQDGSPIAGAKVEAYSTDRRQEATNTHTTSGEDGYFEFNDVRQGSYTLLVRAQGYENHREARVGTGEVTLDLNLTPLPQVSGFVFGPDGKPLQNFVVQLRQPLANTDQTVPVSETKVKVRGASDGAYTLACPRVGEFVVEASHPRHAASFSETFAVEKGGGITGVNVHMTAGGALTGRVVDAQGAPISGARVTSHHTDYVDDPFWRSLGDSYPSAAARKEARTDQSGTYELTSLTPEIYQLHVAHPDYAAVTIRELAVVDGATQEVGDIVLQEGASVTGTVFGPAGTGLAGALVQAVLDTEASGDNFGAFHKARTNVEGRYTFQHLPPGQYMLSVQRQGAADNPFVGMTDQKATRKSIHVIDGRSYTQDFTLSN